MAAAVSVQVLPSVHSLLHCCCHPTTDSHSSTLMLTRLAHLYRQQAGVLGVASGDAAEAAPPGNAGGIVWAKAALLPPIEATPLTADRLHVRVPECMHTCAPVAAATHTLLPLPPTLRRWA